MKQITDDIRSGSFRQIYLLYGPEDYLRKQYRDRLRDAMLPPDGGMGGNSMNLHYFAGKEAIPEEIIDLAETMPFLAERRVLVLENTGFCKSGGDKLFEYLKKPAETASFIFVEKEIDKRNKLYKLIKEKGYPAEFGVQNEATLKKWILSLVKKDGLMIAENALLLLLDWAGPDMENIRSELEKLCCYCMDRGTITMEDVEAICTRQVSGQIFQMIDAVTAGRQREALQLYYDLLSLKEPPLRILFLMARQFNLLLQVKELREQGNDNGTISRKMELQDFLVRKYASLAARMDLNWIKQGLRDCVETEEKIKTGKIGDLLGVELLILTYSNHDL